MECIPKDSMKWLILAMMVLLTGTGNAQFNNMMQRSDNQFVGGVFTNAAQFMSMSAANFFSTQSFNSNVLSMMFWYRNVSTGAIRVFASQGGSTQSFFFQVRNTNIFDFQIFASDGSTVQGDLVANDIPNAITNLTVPHQLFMNYDVTQTNPTNRWKLFFDGIQYTNFDYGGGTKFPTNIIFTSADAIKHGGGDFGGIARSVEFEWAYWNGATPNITNVFGFSPNGQQGGVPLDLLTTAPAGLISWWRAGNNHGASSAPLRGYTNDEINIKPWTANGNVRTTNAPPMQ